MKLFISIFLVLLLSSCSEDGDTATTDVIGSSTANNQEAIKESEKNESIVEERVEEYLNSNDISAGIDLRNNRLYHRWLGHHTGADPSVPDQDYHRYFISTAIGSSRVAVRCHTYSELIGDFLNSRVSMNKINNHLNLLNDVSKWKEPKMFARLKNNDIKPLMISSINGISINGVKLKLNTVKYKTSGVPVFVINSEGVRNRVPFSSLTSIQLSSDFGDLSFSCDQEQTTVNDKVSLVERNGYFGLSPKTKTRFTNEGDYIEAYFDHMNDLGFKEIIFESGDVVGMVLQLKLKT